MKGDIDILARTIFGEARGEYGKLEGGMAALIAVGNVAVNRFKANGWYGQTIGEVCRKPWQFSCWNERDPNRKILIQEQIIDPVFTICYQVATKVILQEWPDLTKGSDHYHTISVNPAWAQGQRPKVRLGQHIFYQLTRKEN
jgi:N-acetylmuramoyl-L-alanine amidase